MARLREAALVVDHLLGVAVVRVDEHVRVQLQEARQDPADACVRHLDGLRGGGLVARVAHHVAVRVVDDDEAVGVVLQALQQFVRHVVGVHLRMGGERGGIEAALHLHLVLARAGRCRLAVEEARDMAELLRLGEAQLADAGLRDDLAEEVRHAAARAHRAEQVVLELVPVAREAEEGDLRARTAHAGVVVAHERLGELDRAVLAVVRVHHDVAVLHARVVAHDVAGNVLVGHRRAVGRLARGVLVLDARLDGRRPPALAADDAVVGFARERPVLHAVHAVVAAHRGADHGVADGGEFLLQAGDVFERRARRRVAAVEERMDDDAALRELGARAPHELEEVFLVGVNALVLQKAEEVELRVVLLPVCDEVLPLRALEELTRGESVVDALQLLHDDAPGAHVEVADFGGALVAVGEAHGLAAAVQEAVRIARPDLVDDGRLRRHHRVPVGTRVHAPAVADDQDNRSHFVVSFSLSRFALSG